MIFVGLYMKRVLATTLCSTLLMALSAFADSASIQRGRYLSVVAGCNDCHTAGFAPSGGKVPESEWLKGDPMGWRGPWGTTYAVNLRKLMAAMTKDSWLTFARNSKARPPMPSYVFSTMTEEDLIALYDFIKSLGDGGDVMPAALPPGAEPTTPYFNFVPVIPGAN